MPRAEPKDEPQPQQDRRAAPRRTPEQAEGDERTVDEALRNQEKQRE